MDTSVTFHTGKIGQRRIFYNTISNKIGYSLVDVYDDNSISLIGLSWFLEIGYVPGNLTLFDGILALPHGAEIEWNGHLINIKNKFSYESLITPYIHDEKSESQLLREGNELFLTTVSSLFNKNNNSAIVTLTSGLDSRLILGALLECTSNNNIKAFTWGEPGSYDYEISKQITKKFGIKHRLIDISSYKLTQDRLENFAIKSDCNVTLFDHWPVDILYDEIGTEPIWMGLLGGSASGSNLPQSAAENPYSYFFKANNRIPSLTSLSSALLNKRPSVEDLKSLSQELSILNHDILDLYFHHERFISHIKLFSNFNYILPFGEQDVLTFFLSLPYNLRKDRSFQKKIITNYYPALAKFGSNRSYGLPLDMKGWKKKIATKIVKTLDNNINKKKKKYINIQDIIIHEKYYKDLFFSKLSSLKKRNIFPNNHIIDIILNEHIGSLGYYINHERALTILVSLEIILEVLNYKKSSQ